MYRSTQRWDRPRPGVLVIACSDGRLQESVDEFLEHRLGVTHYDRLYVPGGPGALSESSGELIRADQFRRECRSLILSHGIGDVILLFHGPSADGPEGASCVDYRRRMNGYSVAEIRRRQEQDAVDIVKAGFGLGVTARMTAYRCEITKDDAIQFVPLIGAATPP